MLPELMQSIKQPWAGASMDRIGTFPTDILVGTNVKLVHELPHATVKKKKRDDGSSVLTQRSQPMILFY